MTFSLTLPGESACLAGRVWRPGIGPALVTVRGETIVDVTCREVPTMSALIEREDAADWLRRAEGETIGGVADLSPGAPSEDRMHLLAPCDLQAVKASGVTFAASMVERVIEERAGGDPQAAEAIRTRIAGAIGQSLSGLKPGSPAAEKAREALKAEGLWSQYLEVGIGPDAEIFTKAQPMSSVGWGAEIGLHPVSRWNNPEPEIVLCVASTGAIRGAALGNDVNLRDVEGRSALLLGKAKDNNAASAIGPFIRLFDDGYSLDDVRSAKIRLTVTGDDGFKMSGASSMDQISRDPADLVSQALGPHHQYPDGLMLYLGTMFAPVKDRDAPGEGFTHHIGDRVTIAEDSLGALVNTVRLSTDCAPWRFGTSALMRNLAGRGLL